VAEQGVTVNLPYWCYPAILGLAELDPAPEWNDVVLSGLRLQRAARFGRWHLPPDWLQLNEDLRPAEAFTPVFGYNAIRIPLYLIWARLEDRDSLKPFLEFQQYFEGARFLPAWTDLSDDSVDSRDAPPGIKAVLELARATVGAETPRLAALDPYQDYYSASLLLLTKLALLEAQQP
jgi:endoglucanase